MKKQKELRLPASDGTQSTTGQARYEVYTNVWRRINAAMDAGFWLEAVTLAESIIADRLEARLAYLAGQSPDGRKVMTANQAVGQLRNGTDASNDSAMELYDRVRAWSDKRNSVLHELAKVFETTTDDWNSRYDSAKEVAEAGVKLARDISALVRKLNKPPSEKADCE